MLAHQAISCHKHAAYTDRLLSLLAACVTVFNAIELLSCNLKNSTDELMLAVHASFTFMYALNALKQSLAHKHSRLTACVCCSDMLGDCDRNDAYQRSDDPPSSG